MRNAREVRSRLMWRVWRRWLPAAFRERFEADLIAHHMDSGKSRGLSSARIWLRLLWDIAATGTALRFADSTEAHRRGGRSRVRLGDVSGQIAIALRRLARAPAFSIGVIVTLALAIGANLTMFSVLDRLLLRPPEGVERPAEVRRVYVFGPTLFDPEPVHSGYLSYPEYAALRGVAGFSAVAAHHAQELTVGRGESAERVRAELATASYFELLGVRAALGRMIGPGDDVLDATVPAAVLSHAYWQRRFGGDRDVLGQELSIGGGRYAIIGVVERAFVGVDLEPVDVWLPLHAAGAIQSGTGWLNSAGWSWLHVLARLPTDGAAVAPAAEAEATARIGEAREQMPARMHTGRAVLASLISARGPNEMREASVARLLLSLASLVLLIGCANVVNLLLARGVLRRRQHAVQRALGASRIRLALELMLEALVLAAVAGALAFLLARGLAPALFRLLVPGPSAAVLAVDRTLLVAAALITIVVLLIGLLPAYRSGAADLMEIMKSRGSDLSTGWVRRSLLIVQAAISIVLLIGAGLFARSLQRALAVDVGLATETLTVAIELEDGTTFGQKLAPAIYAAYERLRDHPRVASTAITSIPPWGGGWGLEVDVPGPATLETRMGPFFVSVGQEYFRTVGIPLLEGRALTAADDREGAEPVVVVNRTMARAAWPGEDPLGKCLLIGKDAQTCSRVVGIAADYRSNLTTADADLLYYIAPRHPGIGFVAATSLVVRVHGDPAAAVADIAQVIRAASPEIRFVNVAPLSARLEPQLRAWRVAAATLAAFALLALIVAAVGLYSVLTFEVTQRRYEIAVRAALGASAADLARAMAARTLLFTFAGIVIGLAVAVALGHAIQSLLFEVEAIDAAVYAAAAATLLAAALVAFLLPVRRARATDPMHVLREE